MNTGRIQFKVLPSCLAKSLDSGSALLKNYVNVELQEHQKFWSKTTISVISDFFNLHVSLWRFQILNGGDFTGDITNLILALKIEY